MFLVAVTTRPLPPVQGALRVQRFARGPLTLTVATDGPPLRWAGQWDRGWALDGSPLAAGANDGFEPPLGYHPTPGDATAISLEVRRPLHVGQATYYRLEQASGFICASHIRLLREAGVTLAENTRRLPELFRYRHIAPPETLYEGIRQLAPGDGLRLVARPAGFELTEIEAFDPDARPLDIDLPEAAARVHEQLRGAVRRLRPASDRLGMLLSGGMDSSVLQALAGDELDLETSYSTGYPSLPAADDLERAYAQSAAAALGSRHRHYRPSADDYREGFIRAIVAAEEPLIHLQSVLLYLLFERGLPPEASLVVSGAGADTLFGQHLQRRLHQLRRLSLLRSLGSSAAGRRAVSVAAGLAGRGASTASLLTTPPSAPISDPRHVVWLEEVFGSPGWIARNFPGSEWDPRENRYELMRRFEGRSELDCLALIALLGSLAVEESIWSKLAQAAGRGLWYPYNDPELVRLSFRLPWGVKLRSPKAVLREVGLRAGVPASILDRPKQSFGLPVERWAPRGALFEPLIPLAAKVIAEPELRALQSSDYVEAHTLWTALNYAVWRRLWIDGEPADDLIEELRSVGPAAGA